MAVQKFKKNHIKINRAIYQKVIQKCTQSQQHRIKAILLKIINYGKIYECNIPEIGTNDCMLNYEYFFFFILFINL
jgi:NADH:ubiquinone oxidoreductase subunit 3 (subunit A)